MNEAGEVAFMAPLTGPSVVDENSQALYADTFGGLSLVARTGTAATALGFGVSYDQIVEHDLSDTGQTLFSARLRGLPVDDTNDSGIFLRGDGPAELVIREGDPAPGLGPGVVFGGLVPGNIPTPALDINDSGKIAFRTMLRGDGVDNSTNGAIYATNDQGDLDLILRDGDQVPGLADGVVFSQSDLGGGIVLNDRGDLLILAQFEGPGIVEENDAAIFYLGADSGYDPQIVVRQGDLLDVDNSPLAEDLRVVEFFDLSLEQFRSSFSDHGQITFQASFTDSSQGVFLATVPEPSAAILAVLLAIGCATTARRLGL
ncbi:MAG: choice-of-anchor tandem repeat NxxGxxAF-containing protein [Actinomycetota bacterium]